MLQKEIEGNILQVVGERKKDNTIIITFANYAYHDILFNWLVSIDKLGIDNYLIFSLDAQTHQFLVDKGIPSVLLPVHGDLSALWQMRLEVFAFISENNTDFIHSDVDAIWLRDPRPVYFEGQSSAFVFSQGTIWPPVVYREWGFVLCCGFFLIRSGAAATALFSVWRALIQESGDDQYSLNAALMSMRLKWNKDDTTPYFLKCDPDSDLIQCFDKVIQGTFPERDETISMLPHHLFQRTPVSEENPYLKHIHCRQKKCDAKLVMLSATASLFLAKNWRDLEFNVDSIDRIASE